MSEVFKFGGSTIKSAQALIEICEIIKNSKDLSYVVVSATFNTTNELEEIARQTLQSKCRANDLIDSLIFKHETLTKDLGLFDTCHPFFEIVKDELIQYTNAILDSLEISKEIMDSVYSLGERICSFLIATYLNEKLNFKCLHLDARQVIKTSNSFNEATPLFGIIKEKISSFEDERSGQVVITQGFIGKTLDGRTTTLGREGSDYTASIIAWAINASKLVIWKDVGEIKSWDPKFQSGAHTISNLSYSEANRLTEAGAKVLFHRTMNPIEEKKIPLEIRGIKNPSHLGTKISTTSFGKIFALVESPLQDKSIFSICGNGVFDNSKILSLIHEIESGSQELSILSYRFDLLSIEVNSHKRNYLLDLLIQVVDESFR